MVAVTALSCEPLLVLKVTTALRSPPALAFAWNVTVGVLPAVISEIASQFLALSGISTLKPLPLLLRLNCYVTTLERNSCVLGVDALNLEQ